ncbi:MAG: hypothetical protein IPO20_10180 [Gammaproteobacteria bacterium]|nr:hypothetical protein [Gammaproteobacteria bacterium]
MRHPLLQIAQPRTQAIPCAAVCERRICCCTVWICCSQRAQLSAAREALGQA